MEPGPPRTGGLGLGVRVRVTVTVTVRVRSQDAKKKSRRWVVVFALTCSWGCLTNIYLWE